MESRGESVCVSRLISRGWDTCLADSQIPLARDHLVNLVTLSSQRYLVDVGMNARGPIVPLPLISDTSAFSVYPRKARLLHGSSTARLDPRAYSLLCPEFNVAT